MEKLRRPLKSASIRNASPHFRVYAIMRIGSRVFVLLLASFFGAASSLVVAQRGEVGNAQNASQTAKGPDGAIAMPPDRAADSYAIYSLLMPGEEFARMAPEQNARWAVAEITVNSEDRNPAVPPQGQLKPPPDNPKGFAEAVGDYNTNKHIRILLTREDFQLDHPFSLLSPDQVNELRGARSGPAVSSETKSQWSGYPGVTYFSEVYFDKKHQAALVYMNDWCAHLCSTGSWVYLEKHGGKWQRRSGIVVPGA